MRRYDDPVEVRRSAEDQPEQFLWHGRLWQVRDVVAHWVETGAWWRSPEARAVTGESGGEESGSRAAAVEQEGAVMVAPDLLRERECWRVQAGRGRLGPLGVFDLVFDWASGDWRLVGCLD